MKRSLFLSVASVSISVIFVACEKTPLTPVSPAPEMPPAPPASVDSQPVVALDAKKLMAAFASAGPEEQSRAGKAAQSIEAEVYPSALGTLEKLLAEGHLTPEQKELVTSFVGQLKQMTAKKP